MDQAHSKSLWNYSLSPGWNEKEVHVLKQALNYFGIDLSLDPKITRITITGGFYGSSEQLWMENSKKEGVLRKFGCVINQGDNPTREERKKRIELNRKKYGLSQQQIQKLKKPFGYQHVQQVMTLQEIDQNSHKLSTLDILMELNNTRKEIVKRLDLSDKIDQDLLNEEQEGEQNEQNKNKNKNKARNHNSNSSIEKIQEQENINYNCDNQQQDQLYIQRKQENREKDFDFMDSFKLKKKVKTSQRQINSYFQPLIKQKEIKEQQLQQMDQIQGDDDNDNISDIQSVKSIEISN